MNYLISLVLVGIFTMSSCTHKVKNKKTDLVTPTERNV